MDAKDKFRDLCRALEAGEIRVAEKKDGEWTVNTWVKEAILEGFRCGELQQDGPFVDKDTLPVRRFSVEDKVRFVPGGSAVRCGAYLAPSVIVMPPSYVNIGAYVDAGSMVDSHVTIGSCAQIGKNVHVSAATQIGGVLEPAGALPVIVEDGAFVGGNCGIYEGTILQEGAVVGSGVILTRSTPVFDAVKGDWIHADAQGRLVIPAGAVVVSGSRPVRKGAGAEAGLHLYCPVIVKYRDGKTDASVTLEDLLR